MALLDSQVACPAFYSEAPLFVEKGAKEQSLVVYFVLLILLFISMIFDLKNHEVPMHLTLTGLIGAGMVGLFFGLWSPVILVTLLILVADVKSRRKRLLFACIFSICNGILQLDSALLSAVICVVWLFWDFGMIGGADVKLLIATLLITGDPAVLIPISIAGGFQGVIACLQKKKEIPFVVSIFLGTFLFVVSSYF